MSDSKDKRLVLGCDIGNGFGYTSLLVNSNEDPMPMFPGSYNLSSIGMPTATYIAPPDGKEMVTFKDGKPAELIYKSVPSQIVRAIKTRFKEGAIAVPGVSEPVDVGSIYSAIVRDLLALAQEELKNKCREEYFTLLLRRFMMKIAEKTAIRYGCGAIITGESVGQVASQTIPALTVTNNAVKSIPVIRPLIADDKEEIVKYARHIGTFETSILPYEDCCTVFTPKHPVTKPVLENILNEENKLDVETLIADAIETRSHIKLERK